MNIEREDIVRKKRERRYCKKEERVCGSLPPPTTATFGQNCQKSYQTQYTISIVERKRVPSKGFFFIFPFFFLFCLLIDLLKRKRTKKKKKKRKKRLQLASNQKNLPFSFKLKRENKPFSLEIKNFQRGKRRRNRVAGKKWGGRIIINKKKNYYQSK